MKRLLFSSLAIMTLTLFGSIISMEQSCRKQKIEVEQKGAQLNQVAVEVENKEYLIAQDALANSGTLKNMMHDVGISESIPLPNVTREVWEGTILSALTTGKKYKITDTYKPRQLIEIIKQANYLDIDYLSRAATEKIAAYIRNNINEFGRDPQKGNTLLDEDVPEEIREEIAHKVINKYEFVTEIDVLLSNSLKRVGMIAFSPDNKTLASGSFDDNFVRLWDVSTGKAIKMLIGHEDQVSSVAFSPDGKTLASCSGDGSIKLWDVATGNLIATFTIEQHRKPMMLSVAFSADSKKLASGLSDGTIRLWDVLTGKEINKITGHADWVASVVFSHDDKILASAGDNVIKLWDVKTGLLIKTLCGGDKSMAFNVNSTLLVSGSTDDTIKLWNVVTGDLLQTFVGHSESVNSVVFSPDGKTVVSGSGDGFIKVWDVATGRPISTYGTGNKAAVNSVAFSPDGKKLASGLDDGTIRVWAIPNLDFTFQQTLYVYYVLNAYNNMPYLQFLKLISTERLEELGFTDEQGKLLHKVINKYY